MNGFKKNLVKILFIWFVLISVKSDLIEKKIYKQLENRYKCVRRLNYTNQIGCFSKESGNVGMVHMVREDIDLDYVLQSGRHYPYIPVLIPKYFNLQILNRFKSSSDRISGVLLLDKGVEAIDSYSADKSCPNSYFDLYVDNKSYGHCVKQKWNVVGGRDNERIDESLMFNDWPFPIFLIRNETNITELQDCFDKHSKEWPLCAVEVTASTYAAKDAITCIRRSNLVNNPFNFIKKIKFCEPLVVKNIFSTLLPENKNTSFGDKSVVVLSAKLDSFSMFSTISPGADSVITSVITLLSIAHTLSQTSVKEELRASAPDKNILFALFDGESFDYIGSSSVVFDMYQGKFPVDPEKESRKGQIEMPQIRTKHFSHFIELNQLGLRANDDKQTLYLHKNIDSNNQTNDLIQLLQSNGPDIPSLKFEEVNDGTPLPPSSLQTFLKDDNSLIGVVIANHRKEFTNKFYNSLFDTFDRLNTSETKLIKSLTDISTVISRTVLNLITSSPKQLKWTNITANQTLVKELFQCYFVNTNCSLFNTVKPFKQVNQNKTFETYIASDDHSFTFRTLSYFTGKEVSAETEKECYSDTRDKTYDYSWISGPFLNGICIASQSLRINSKSPAFMNDGISNSSLYSTWTQSKGREFVVRLFLSSSPSQQWLTLGIGIFLLIVSTIVILLFQTYAKGIFNLAKIESSTTERVSVRDQTDPSTRDQRTE